MTGPGLGEVLRCATQAEFEAWLEEHHADSRGIWLQIAKKDAPRPTVTYVEAVEAALCFGWIDGQKARDDDAHWRQRFTPRSPRSRWSQINRDKAEQLIAAGRMRAAGSAEVQRARLDGRWDAAYPSPRNATVPQDLQEALDAEPALASAFADLDARNRYAILWRLADAKRPETRARRMSKYLDMLRRGERLHE